MGQDLFNRLRQPGVTILLPPGIEERTEILLRRHFPLALVRTSSEVSGITFIHPVNANARPDRIPFIRLMDDEASAT